ncbi:MAG TPA: RluA family pseudouridine synthase [Candidatus Saccharimonadales bacterium]|nr:RluA family pseudouridine synthase [Candidatus Saccharimonadales bacterium]
MSNLEVSRAQRLDQKVVELVPELSRGYAARLVEEGKVTVNGAAQTKPGYKLRVGDDVAVDFDVSELGQIPDIDLPVLYEDDDCVVIYKPVGVLSHSKGTYNPEATVATWLRKRLADHKNSNLDDSPLDAEKDGVVSNRAGIVHRLDRATSGVMICAKTSKALSWLQKQFATRNVKKTYAAVISGRMEPAEAIIDMPIGRNPKAPATFRVDVQGKPAKTAYQTVRSNETHSLVELKPETGRTHQLRVHLAHQHHPIVGDVLYGGEPAERLYLHAEILEITILKGHERKVFTAPIPDEFSTLVA